MYKTSEHVPQVGRRVKIHPATDAWMQGDRYGEVVKIGLDRCPLTCRVHSIQFFTREQVEASRKAKADILARQTLTVAR